MGRRRRYTGIDKLYGAAPRKPRPRARAPKGDQSYRQLWRVVDGAVMDAFAHHPEYLAPHRGKDARLSVVKRVVGAIQGYAAQAVRGRSGRGPAAITESDVI